MRKSRFTEEQITMAHRQGEAGTPVGDLPEDGRQRGDVLSLEEEVRGPRDLGASRAAAGT